MKNIKLAIYDFHRTLSNTRFFQTLDENIQQKVAAYFQPGNCELSDKWFKGELSTECFVALLAEEIQYSKDLLMQSLMVTDKFIVYNRYVFDSVAGFRKRGIKTAIATINCDYFTRYLVPALKLNRIFDYIANSADYKTLDKIKMIGTIMMEFNVQPEETILIDDGPGNINGFTSLGGHGYHYTDDQAFGKWFENQMAG